MPRKAKTGDTIENYRIEKELNAGAMAVAYKARRGDETVFLKQYKSPTPTVPWYRKYVEYQQELKRRIESTSAKNFSYRFVEFFEGHFGGKNFFQVFEWVEGGRDLEHLLEEARSSGEMSWTQRLTLAKVMMAGINAIHEAGIIHCDLKPPNIYLFHDPDIEAGYRLKVIDMDFSILSDRQAPWHGSDTGYVGTPRYFSPEHLSSQVPCQASDIFTCGIILYELLTGHHPYNDESTYSASVSGWKAPAPAFLGQIGDSEDLTNTARQLLHLCLHPNNRIRPSAKDLNLALRGKFTGSVAYPPPSGPAPSRSSEPPSAFSSKPIPEAGTSTAHSSPVPPAVPPSTPPPPPPSPAERRFQPLELAAEGGKVLMCGIRTDVGKHVCMALGEDAKFMHDTKQFSLVPDEAANAWILEPNAAAKNQTIVNGKAASVPVTLAHGDVVGVGNEAKGIVKLPLTVRVTSGK
jgi:serine/threonine protein kinase